MEACSFHATYNKNKSLTGEMIMKYQKRPVNIEGWEMYQCDTDGVVYGQNGEPLKPNINSRGYKYVVFCKNKKMKTFVVHRIIALTFVPNPMNFPIVNHKDGNKLNNNAENFEWTTNSGNTVHARDELGIEFGEVNRKAIQVFDKKTGELKYEFSSLSDAAHYFVKPDKNFRCVQSAICDVLKKRKKSYKNCIWQYKVTA